MKMNYKLVTVGLIILAIVGTIALALAEDSTSDRKIVIESRRYIGDDGKTTFDKWITSSIEIKEKDQYVVFFPIEGENAGKKHYIPFSNIHIIREL